MNKPEILGVDVGGVILDFIRYFDTDLDFRGENYLQTPEIEGAIDSIAQLNKGRFKDRVHVVTRYDTTHGPGRVIEWLESKDFFGRTGIPMERYHPCAERHEKAPICVELGITHFVDDRAEVLSHMIGQVENLYLFKSPDAEKEEFVPVLSNLKKMDSWEELLGQLR
jgi:hypothetical protein